MRLASVAPALLLLAALLAPGAAGADAGGTIAGRVVNRTPGGPVPAGAEVVLHVFRGGAHLVDRPGAAGGDGGFAFAGLDTDPAYAYQLTAAYGGAPYASEPLSFARGETSKGVDVDVYETTGVDPGLRVRRASLIFADVDPTSQTVGAVELLTLENPSGRTFLPSPNGPAGPMGLLRFPLPTHAGDLRPGPGLDSAEIIQVDRGFAATRPLPPGDTEVAFSYRFPYRPGRVLVTRSVPYPTAELRVVVAPGGPAVESADLEPGPPLELGGQLYRLQVARDLPAGAQVALTLVDLPGRWPLGLPLDDVPAPLWGGLGAVAALGLAAACARRAGRGPAASADVRDDQRHALVAEIAALDDAFAAGGLSEDAYLVRRTEAKARLRGLLRTGRPGRVQPPPAMAAYDDRSYDLAR